MGKFSYISRRLMKPISRTRPRQQFLFLAPNIISLISSLFDFSPASNELIPSLLPVRFLTSTSAPLFTKNLTASKSPATTASNKGVRCNTDPVRELDVARPLFPAVSSASISAPRDRRRSRMGKRSGSAGERRRAICSALLSGSAPRENSSWRLAREPRDAMREMGVW